jgi:hypothetical protein
MHRMAFAAGFAFAVGIGGVTSAQAGLLDFIFGWRDRTDLSRAEAVRHPQVTISARPKAKRDARAPRGGGSASRPAYRAADRRETRVAAKASKSAPSKPAAPVLTAREQLARTIDPAKNPRWWLEDPTLRKGDVLVLNDRVVVFTGGTIGSPKSYVALSRTKLLSAKERARIATQTGLGAPPAAVADGGGPRKMRAAFRLRGAARG